MTHSENGLQQLIGARSRFNSYSKKGKINLLERDILVDERTFSIWSQAVSTSTPDDPISLHDIQEIRRGFKHKDFDGCKERDTLAFTIIYGKEFRTKSLSLVAPDSSVYALWVGGLESLLAVRRLDPAHHPEAWHFSEHALVTQYLRNEYGRFGREQLTPKDIAQFLKRGGLKTERAKVKQLVSELRRASGKGSSNHEVYGFEDLALVYSHLQRVPEIESLFEQHTSKPHGTVRLMDKNQFAHFLLTVQKDDRATDMHWVTKVMRTYCHDQSHQDNPVLDVIEFQAYMLSRHNELFNPQHDAVYQDMNQPISHYFAASSHNTYLMGDQLRSESSTEAYIRILRAGCRCIELDCWDGDNGRPIITHGNTLCSKIPFEDVVKVIAEHAFTVSKYPLVLSLENHCTVPQQEQMARIMKEHFGDHLQSAIIDSNAADLPSPTVLMEKILLKDKKNPERRESLDEARGSLSSSSTSLLEEDVSNTHNGDLYMLTPDGYRQYYTSIQGGQLVMMDLTSDEPKDDEPDNTDLEHPEEHWTEVWFHPRETREGAVAKLKARRTKGCFLVRPRENTNTWAISYWFNGPNHVIIEHKNGVFYIVPSQTFRSINDLIENHQKQPLTPKDGDEVTLTEPIPCFEELEDANFNPKYPWYNSRIQRWEAEHRLKRTNQDGSFLVRQGQDGKSYAISFRAGYGIKHCKLTPEGRMWMLGPGMRQFESIPELVAYYSTHPMYRKTCLKHPVNLDIARQQGPMDNELYVSTYIDPNYIPVNQMAEQSQQNQQLEVVRAKYDYKARNDGELSFTKGTIIRIITKEDEEWWQGECEGEAPGRFMCTYVESLETGQTVGGAASFGGSGNEPRKFTIPLATHTVAKLDHYQFQLTNRASGEKLLFSIAPSQDSAPPDSEQQVDTWVHFISQVTAPEQQIAARAKPVALPSTNMPRCKNLSDLISYCQSVKFVTFKDPNRKPWEMSSFVETKIKKLEKMAASWPADFLEFNQKHLSRVYPAGVRFDSSNYDPQPMWICGCQLVALNYQTPGRFMQINRGRFRDNGNCGYVLKPERMRTANPRHIDTSHPSPVQRELIVEILSGRNLSTTKGVPSPFVEVEIIGVGSDNEIKRITKESNGLCPKWDKQRLKFTVRCPDMALVRFAVVSEDTFGDSGSLGESVLPFHSLQSGYRRIQLFNGHGEELPLATLLVKVTITDGSVPEVDGPVKDQDLQQQRLSLSQSLLQLVAAKSDATVRGDRTKDAKLNGEIASVREQMDRVERLLQAQAASCRRVSDEGMGPTSRGALLSDKLSSGSAPVFSRPPSLTKRGHKVVEEDSISDNPGYATISDPAARADSPSADSGLAVGRKKSKDPIWKIWKFRGSKK